MNKPKAHVSEFKKKEVERIKKLLSENEVIGILDLTNLPSAQFQKLKNKLKKNLEIRVSKKSLILEDYIIYSSDRQKITGLNMGLINQRQCYTKLQRIPMDNNFIFRGQYFEKSGRNPEDFLESVVREIEKNK